MFLESFTRYIQILFSLIFSIFSFLFLLTQQQGLLYYSSSEGKQMSRTTISTFQLFQAFPDVETARKYLESKLWPNGPVNAARRSQLSRLHFLQKCLLRCGLG